MVDQFRPRIRTTTRLEATRTFVASAFDSSTFLMSDVFTEIAKEQERRG
jgi:hypothetical protein